MWYDRSMMGYWNSNNMYGWLPMILFLGVLIMGFVLLIKYFYQADRKTPSDKTPLDTLKERYAKGEIDKNQFDEIKKNLL